MASYTLEVSATDLAGNTSSASIQFTVDKTPPAIDLHDVLDGQFSNLDTTPLFSVDDPNVVSSASVLTFTDTLGQETVTDPFASGTVLQGEGTYALSVSATDCAGKSVVEDITFTIDTTAPEVLSVLPADAEVGLAINTFVTAVFSEPLDATTLTTDSVILDDGSEAVIADVVPGLENDTLTLVPLTNLLYATDFVVVMTTDIRDRAAILSATSSRASSRPYLSPRSPP